jgi:hypothetical protein
MSSRAAIKLREPLKSTGHLERLKALALLKVSKNGSLNTKDPLSMLSMTEPSETFSEIEESELFFSSLLKLVKPLAKLSRMLPLRSESTEVRTSSSPQSPYIISYKDYRRALCWTCQLHQNQS